MRWIRRGAGALLMIIGSALVVLAVGFMVAVIAQGHEAWVFGLLLLPMAAIFLAAGQSVWASRPLRPVLGLWMAIAGFGYGLFTLPLTAWIAYRVARSPSLLAGIGFIAVIPPWVLAVLTTGIAGVLVRGTQRLTLPLFLGSAICWLGAWISFWLPFLPGILQADYRVPLAPWGSGLPSPPNPTLDLIQKVFLDPESWVIHGFFLLPTLLALVMAWRVTRTR